MIQSPSWFDNTCLNQISFSLSPLSELEFIAPTPCQATPSSGTCFLIKPTGGVADGVWACALKSEWQYRAFPVTLGRCNVISCQEIRGDIGQLLNKLNRILVHLENVSWQLSFHETQWLKLFQAKNGQFGISLSDLLWTKFVNANQRKKIACCSKSTRLSQQITHLDHQGSEFRSVLWFHTWQWWVTSKDSLSLPVVSFERPSLLAPLQPSHVMNTLRNQILKESLDAEV